MAPRIVKNIAYVVQQAFTEITDKTSTTVNMRRSFSQLASNESKMFKRTTEKKSKQISMSGLISYNFKSIKSKNRLAFSRQGDDEEMQEEIAETKKRTRASMVRDNKIHHKTDPSDNLR